MFATLSWDRCRHWGMVALLLTLPSFALIGCSRAAESSLATTSMKIGSKTFTLEIADNDASQTTGLMRRKSMDADHGMIFVFPKEDPRPLTFWMADTYISLDILFLDHTGKVVSIHQMVAYDRSTTSSDHPAQYAIELNRGAAADAGVHVGDQLIIPKEAQAPAPAH